LTTTGTSAEVDVLSREALAFVERLHRELRDERRRVEERKRDVEANRPILRRQRHPVEVADRPVGRRAAPARVGRRFEEEARHVGLRRGGLRGLRRVTTRGGGLEAG